MTSAPRYRRPAAGPTEEQLAEDRAWREYCGGSLERARSSAEQWRTGLGLLVTVMTGGLILKGPSSTAELDTPWRVVLTTALAVGFLGAFYGLWCAARAAAVGGSGRIDRDRIRARYGTLERYKDAAAAKSNADLRKAKAALMASLPLVVAATLLSWWAPRQATATASSPAAPQLFRVSSATETFCGELLSSHGTLQIYSAASHTLNRVRFAHVASVEPVSSCGAPDR